MNEELIYLFGVTVTPWKLIGYFGVCLFTSRWFIQVWASKKAGKPTVPILFWILSIFGSFLCLMYFTFGKNDSVGILAYLFPSVISVYNLKLELLHRKKTESKTLK